MSAHLKVTLQGSHSFKTHFRYGDNAQSRKCKIMFVCFFLHGNGKIDKFGYNEGALL